MDGNQFDRIAKWMSTRQSRRSAVRAIAAGALGGAAAVAGVDGTLAGKPVKPDCCPANAPKLCGVTCTDTITDLNNCGSCGRVCPSPANGSATCTNGICGVTCNTGSTNCGGVCVSTQTDSANCGTCGHACGAGQTCTGGACVTTISCTNGIKDGNETDKDCGGGTCPPCAAGQGCNVDADCQATLSCINHVCGTCPAGQRACNNVCVDTSTNTNNCGGCGVTCSIPNGTASCVAGICHVGACNTGFADCDNNPANGCEVNVSNDSSNCGACGNVCGSGTSCVNGACVVACISPANCPPTGNECIAATCVNNICGTTFVAANTPTSSGQTPGDCQVIVCNGSGGTISIADNTDVPADDGNFCTTDICNGGVPTHPAKPAGTACAPAACLDSSTLQPASTCNGTGACVAPPQIACPSGQTCMTNACVS